jgi:hypothetical protein
LAQELTIEYSPWGKDTPLNDQEVAMTPGIGFLALMGILFIGYVVFLIQQNKLQDEIARHRSEQGGVRS